MKIQDNKDKYQELSKWYRRSVSPVFKKEVFNNFSNIKKLVHGKHALFLGLTEYKKKFESAHYLSFLDIDGNTLYEHESESKKLPFEDNSHDVIIILHGLDSTNNPYNLIREIDRIATDDAKIALIGFNNFSLWGLMKPLMKKSSSPWSSDFHSVFSVKEWFKILSYDVIYKDTSNVMPISNQVFQKYLNKIGFLQKFLLPNLGGIYYYVFNKKILPLTPVKVSFKQKYVVSPFPKSSLNRIK